MNFFIAHNQCPADNVAEACRSIVVSCHTVGASYHRATLLPCIHADAVGGVVRYRSTPDQRHCGCHCHQCFHKNPSQVILETHTSASGEFRGTSQGPVFSAAPGIHPPNSRDTSKITAPSGTTHPAQTPSFQR